MGREKGREGWEGRKGGEREGGVGSEKGREKGREGWEGRKGGRGGK